MSQIGEPLREMASALVDGEAGEFECRRVLESMDDAAVGALLTRHYAVRSVLRREAPGLCPAAVSRAIFEALDAEALPLAGARPARWRGWVGGAAVAASVCLVTVIGSRAAMQSDSGAPAPALAARSVDLGPLGTPHSRTVAQPGAGVPVGFGSIAPGAPDQAARERLQLFMLEHAGNAALNGSRGMMPFARVVSDEDP